MKVLDTQGFAQGDKVTAKIGDRRVSGDIGTIHRFTELPRQSGTYAHVSWPPRIGLDTWTITRLDQLRKI